MVILGAGGHAKVTIDVIKSCRDTIQNNIVVLDDNPPAGKRMGNYDISGTISECVNFQDQTSFIIAIGDNKTRKKIAMTYELNYETLIHSSAIIGDDVVIDKGTIVMAGVVINHGSRIGKHCIINTGSTVDHDCILHDFVHISPGVHLGGTVEIGNGCWIGIGSCIKNNLSLGSDCIIGAGAVVIRDIPDQYTVVGNPAKPINF